jgi:hypothetical protein
MSRVAPKDAAPYSWETEALNEDGTLQGTEAEPAS